MLERLYGNAALKADWAAALAAKRLPHALLLLGEAGCGAGFAARCLAADWLYPAGGPHAEAVLAGQDSECITLRPEGAGGFIRIERIREARAAIGRSALSADAGGRVLFLYDAGRLNTSSANALLKILEEPPADVLFLLTAQNAAAVLPTVRSRCAAYTLAPVPHAECVRALRAALPRLGPAEADELAFLYGGRLGAALDAARDPACRGALQTAKTLCACAMQNDAYRVQAVLAGAEKDRDAAKGLLWQLQQVCAAALRRPGFAGLAPARAAAALRALDEADAALRANASLRLTLAVLGAALADGGRAAEG